jgi:uncharacterized membrane protein required for colicin V production
MFLTILDLVVILVIFLFIAFGFALGFIHALGSLVGIVLGSFIAGLYYQVFGDWLKPYLLGWGSASNVLAFLIIFAIANRLVGLVFYIVDKIFHIIAIIPFVKSFNRLIGAIFGAIEGVLFVGVVMYVISQLSVSDWLLSAVEGSQLAQWMIYLTGVILYLLPESLKG